jgi:hypothetical protein|tara:strand:+ start:147 stop:392 length:246 start_codon:yes stop_codon:yes gene_type:complete
MPSEKMKSIAHGWYTNRARAKRFANAPRLSTEEELFAITQFLKQGKGKRYPLGATLNSNFKDDDTCNKLLKQVTTIEYKDG